MVQTISIDESFEKLIKIVTPLKPLFNIPNMSNELSTQLALLAEHPDELELAVNRIRSSEQRKKLFEASYNVGESVKGMSEAATTTKTTNPSTGETEFLTKGGAPIEVDEEFE